MIVDPSIVGTKEGYILMAVSTVVFIVCIVLLRKSNIR